MQFFDEIFKDRPSGGEFSVDGRNSGLYGLAAMALAAGMTMGGPIGLRRIKETAKTVPPHIAKRRAKQKSQRMARRATRRAA